jgi:hypothetical protein
VGVDRSALTTIPRRSFAGPGLGQFAYTLVVCVGLVLLLPAAVASDREASTGADASSCAASPDHSRDQQLTDDLVVEAPDSCDDDDGDDDDGDEDGPSGSGHAISASYRLASFDDTSQVLHGDVDPRIFRPLDAHSLRGPPAFHQESSDADVDDDDDDDSLSTHHSAPSAAAARRAHDILSTVHFFHPASLDSGNALRAPPQ